MPLNCLLCQKIKMNKYSFNIAWSEEDEEFVATCPAFPGLSALGETEEEALTEAKVALRLFIKTCEEKSIPLPEPQIIQQYSGQFRVRLTKTLHRKLAQQAEVEGVSLNSLILSYLSEFAGIKTEAKRQKEERNRFASYVPQAPSSRHVIVHTELRATMSTAFPSEGLSPYENASHEHVSSGQEVSH